MLGKLNNYKRKHIVCTGEQLWKFQYWTEISFSRIHMTRMTDLRDGGVTLKEDQE